MKVKKSSKRKSTQIRYVRGSPMRAKSFQACIESARISYKGSACLDVFTKWNSTYLMLDTTLKLRKAFERLEEDDPFFSAELEDETPKNEDWEKCQSSYHIFEEVL
ncbi:zinc finger BED domain-containing protein RICESLEEPER 2-like [Rhodamnia argentea]|uniref:Zinc finger BED domain-containing protein RICESLEEPER 2-like n=1 Tax=Rhodamnia argentea TaxID=178133 RepID=A0A8B8QW87_9MYRT|nr:zinc finger BED domain-containing protein RICESLEEPER 2-like [Rhodamnia argentea]